MSAPLAWNPAVVTGVANASQIDQFLTSHRQVYINQGATSLSGGFAGYAALATNTGSAAQWLDQPIITTSIQTTIPRIDLSLAGPAGPSTTIASGSNNVILPQATINVASTTGFPSSGVIAVTASTGQTGITLRGAEWGVQTAGAVASVALPAHSVVAGNSVVIAVTGRAGSAPTAVTPSDNFTNTWTLIDGVTYNATSRTEVWRCANLNTTGSMTITLTPSLNAGMVGSAWEFVGMDTSTNKDVSTNATGASNSATATTAATNAGNELVFACVADANGTATFSAQTFTPSTTPTLGTVWNATGTTCGMQAAWEIEGASTGTQTYAATLSSGVLFAEVVATFKAAPPGWGNMPQLVSYTGTSGGNQFTGCTGGIGTILTGNAVNITAADTTVTLQADAIGYVSPSGGSVNPAYTSSLNLLSAVNASFETGMGQWNNDTNVVVSQTTAQALDGTHSLQMSSVAAGTMKTEPVGINGTTAVPVTGGATYEVSAYVRAATVARLTSVNVLWYNLDGSFISAGSGTAANDSTSAWTQYIFGQAAPAAAAFGTVQVVVQSTGGASEIHYVDQVMFAAGGNFTWTIPTGTVTDTTASWIPNQWVGKQVWIPSTAEFPATATVLSNTQNTLTLTGSIIPSAPSNGTGFVIYGTPSGTAIASTPVPFDFIPTGITTIAAGSNGVALPAATINVVSTSGFLPQGQLWVTNNNSQPQIVNYTGVTATSFTGCTFGTGTMATGGAVVASKQMSIPLNATVYANTNYHIVVAGTQSTTNFVRVLAGQARNANANTGTAAAGPWTSTANSFVFATFQTRNGVLRNVYEDNGLKWTEHAYYGLGGRDGPPSTICEYVGDISNSGFVSSTSTTYNSAGATDANASWVTNQWAGRTVTTSTSVGNIISNTSNTITVGALGGTGWNPGTPAPGVVFTINPGLNPVTQRSVTFNTLVGGVLSSSSTQNSLSPVTWNTPASGATIKATDVNQLMGTHNSQYWYFGPVVDQIATATTGTVKTNGGAAQWVACAFNTGTLTSVGLIQLGLANVGTGSDVTVELRTDNAGVPSNTVLASVVIPVEFIGSALSYAVAGTTGWLSFPLLATGLTTNTRYWVVFDGTASATNYVTIAQTTAVANKHTFTSTTGTGTWVDTTNSAPITVLGGNSQPSGVLMGTIEDYTIAPNNGTQSVIGAPARWTAYRYGVSSGFQNAPPDAVGEYQGTFRNVRILRYGNLLTYANSNFESGTGTWVADTNITISTTTTQFYDGSHALQLSSNAAGDMVVDVSTVSPSAGFTCAPGQVVNLSAWVRTAVSARSCFIRMLWYNSSSSLITSVDGAHANDATGSWTQIFNTSLIAPALTAFFIFQVFVQATGAASEIHYLDGVVATVEPRPIGLTDVI